jgi:formylglycine-generating enzyme required for sulfatase activity
MSDIFLSYAREDRARAKPVVDALESKGWSVFWDPKIVPGQTWDEMLQTELDAAYCVIVLWSWDSVRSEGVSDEAHEGKRRGIIVPALIDDLTEENIPYRFRRIHAANLVGWKGALPHTGFEDLARAVEGLLATRADRPAKVSTVTAPAPIIQPAPPPLTGVETQVNPKDGLTYVWIPPGKFMMGCSPDDSERGSDEKPPHEVTITRGFWMGQTPVTEAAYARFAKAAGKSAASANPDLPVVNVSWEDAQGYCQWAGLRLPTEAEWEYTARAGTTGSRYGILLDIAWYQGNSEGKLHPVRGKQPNAWGLYDMLGNVWEWVADWYEEKYYGRSPATDPAGPASGQSRVRRGGSWDGAPKWVRASVRSRYEPEKRRHLIGFRCAGELR